MRKKIKISYIQILLIFLPTIFLNSLEEKSILNKEIKLEIEFSGITESYDEYDIKAEFDGSPMSIFVSTFQKINSNDVLIKFITGEAAALLKTAKDPQEKKEIINRWKNMMSFSDIKAPFSGIITKIYINNESFVNKGEKLITIARKMRVVAKNKEQLLIDPIPGLITTVETQNFKKYKAILTNFIQEDKGKWKLFFDLENFSDLKGGEKIKGTLIIANKNNARVIPNSDIFEYNNKKYILIEFEPGIINENETEIISFKYNYLKISKDIFKYVK
ncbi:MAG: hypothetical protein N2446_00325 [Elusimicrobiales bacterium]|nr:hypothetical protein [Elusimicrobiales bacterium]